MKNSSGCPPGSLTLQWVVLPIAYSWIDERVASCQALRLYSIDRLLLFSVDQRSLRVSQSWGPHFYTIHGFGVGLFFGLVASFWLSQAGVDLWSWRMQHLFFLDSCLPMRWWGKMYLTWIVLHTSNHGWLECTRHAIDVELDLPFADVDCFDNLEERSPKDEWQ
jgi:hypothetical protein